VLGPTPGTCKKVFLSIVTPNYLKGQGLPPFWFSSQ
jgi:hypothetical protein